MSKRLSGKAAVITGAASGVGRAAALLFAREGADVMCVDIDETMGAETVDMVTSEGGSAAFVRTDLAETDQIAGMAAACLTWRSTIHVLFNNAAICDRQDFEAVVLKDWHRHIAINLTAPFLCSQLLIPALKAAGSSSIIHHGSIDGVQGNPTCVPYSVSKGGLMPLTHVMAHSLGPFGIRVNCINSAAIKESSQGIPVRMTPENRSGRPMTDVQRKATPLGRPAKVEEAAAIALFLASDESSYMSGSEITMDGGRTGVTPGTVS